MKKMLKWYRNFGFTTIKDYKTYYTVKEIINNYIVYMKQVNGDELVDIEKLNMPLEEVRKEIQKEGIIAIKGLLDKQYINDLSIKENTIISEQNKYKKNGNYDKEVTYNLNIEEMVESDINKDITIVLVEFKLNDESLKMLIKLDKINNTHAIFLEDYIEKYNYSAKMNKDEININTSEIEANSYNSYIKVEATETYILSQYFSEYRMKMINDTKNAYELLNSEYKEEKFGSYENFENYIKSNIQNISYASINKYQINEHEGIKEYICIDQNGKYYIFLEKSVGEYNVVLDTYTIDLPEFLEKYNSNEDEIKAGLNIQKIFDAINDGDYNYVYKKLDNTFKQNNFPTEESFKNYAKQYFSSSQLEHDECEKSGNLFVYDITVTQENNNVVKKTFIMKLLEETDFVFSFNIQ